MYNIYSDKDNKYNKWSNKLSYKSEKYNKHNKMSDNISDSDEDLNEQCISFSNNKWNRVSCKKKLRFVCIIGYYAYAYVNILTNHVIIRHIIMYYLPYYPNYLINKLNFTYCT